MKRIYVITGANGHLGYTIVKKLSSEEVEIRALVLPNENPQRLEEFECKIFLEMFVIGRFRPAIC